MHTEAQAHIAGIAEGHRLYQTPTAPMADNEILCDTCDDLDTGASPCHAIPREIADDYELHNAFCSGVISVVNAHIEEEQWAKDEAAEAEAEDLEDAILLGE